MLNVHSAKFLEDCGHFPMIDAPISLASALAECVRDSS